MMDLCNEFPEKLFDENWLPTYNADLSALWYQIIRLNSSVFILKKIDEFPERVFVQDGPFWDMTFMALYDSCILILWKLTNRDGKSFTLPYFRDQILDHLLTPKYKDLFKSELRKAKFASIAESIADSTDEIRNKQIAHSDRDWRVNPSQQEIALRKMDLETLEKLTGMVNPLFDVLCFGGMREKTVTDYISEVRPGYGMDARSDVEVILDYLALNDPLMKMPEQQPDFWPMYRDHNLSPSDIEVLNTYRKKFNLPEIS
jgi:hypothetical protein